MAIKVAYNQEMYRRLKHIAIRYFYIREAQTSGVINTSYVSFQKQLADAFSKPLAAQRFIYLRSTILMVFGIRRSVNDGNSVPISTVFF